MKEFNNRQIANKFAEYVTGKELRRYLAQKVKKYCGENPTVFDGACGSGQLEEFIDAKFIYGVEIQSSACEAFKENYPNSKIENVSFFNYKSDVKADCVVMNYPFSLKFKELELEEQNNIRAEFDWKKTGVVDDIFILKSLNYTERYGFYICFPGIAYRRAENKMRELLHGKIIESNIVHNAFKDTSIDVLFLVVDKENKKQETYKEIYDCKQKKLVYNETSTDAWERITEPIEKEIIDIVALEKEIEAVVKKRRQIEDELDNFIKDEVKPLIGS